MIDKLRPYNAGEIRITPDLGTVLICGHIWWPVERRNAYYIMKLDTKGEPTGDPIYEWDHTNGKWPLAA